jgi:hypothetical protein
VSANYWVDVVFSATAPAAVATTSSPDPTAPAFAQPAGRVEPDPARPTDAAEDEERCTGVPGDLRRGGHAGVRRFRVERDEGGYRLRAIARFAFPAGLDLGTSGMTLVFEDGARRPLLTVDLPGSNLEPTSNGWQASAGVPAVERFTVRRRGGDVVLSLRARFPPFDVVDASSASAGSADPSLHWRVRFGAVCADSLPLTCTEDARDRRRCRSWSRAVHH